MNRGIHPLLIFSGLLLAATAAAQRTYEGPMQMGHTLRYVRLYLYRDRLVEWKDGKRKEVGWRYRGGCRDTVVRAPAVRINSDTDMTPSPVSLVTGSSDEFSYQVSGTSSGPDHSEADSARVRLQFTGDSLSGKVEGEFTRDGRFIGNWKSFDGDGSLTPFELKLKSRYDDDGDTFYATDFPPFWEAFCDALRRRDAEATAGMIHFPLQGPKCLAHALSLPLHDNSRVNHKDFVSKFNRVFDSVTTAELVRMGSYEIDTELLSQSLYGLHSDVGEDSLVYIVTLYPTSGEGYSRTFTFGRIRGEYRLMGIECMSTEGC